MVPGRLERAQTTRGGRGCGAKHLYARVRSDRQLCRTLVAVDLADTHRDKRSPGPRAGGTAPAQADRRDVGRRYQRLSEQLDRKSVGEGKSVSGSENTGGRRRIKKTKRTD